MYMWQVDCRRFGTNSLKERMKEGLRVISHRGVSGPLGAVRENIVK